MNNRITIILTIIFLLTQSTKCLEDRYVNHYRNLLIRFYSNLYSENASQDSIASIYTYGEYEKDSHNTNRYSGLFLQIRKHYFNDLTNGLELTEIVKIINRVKPAASITEFGVIMEVPVSDSYSIFYELDRDIPGKIENIYSKGLFEIGNFLLDQQKEYLLLPGVINDKDGYVNIRKEPNINSEIVGKITTKEIFSFTPDIEKDWWRVHLGEITGFVHKSRITRSYSLSE